MPNDALRYASTVGFLTSSNQGSGIVSMNTSTPTASGSISTSQAQSASQPQGSLLTALHTSTTTLHAEESSSGPAITSPSGSPIELHVIGEILRDVMAVSAGSLVTPQNPVITMSTQNTGSPSVYQGLEATQGASTILQPSTLTNDFNRPIHTSESVLVEGGSISVPPPITDINSGVVHSTQTNRVSSYSQYILPTSQTLSPILSVTLDSAIPSVVPFFRAANTQSSLVSDSGPSLSTHATTMSDLYVGSPLTTIGKQTMTADGMGRYPYDSQTLTSGGTVTVSSTKISLAPNGSNVVVGTSTEVPWPSITAKVGSVPNGTGVQIFKGNAVGARDGSWGSSILLLVAMAVLLRV